MDWGIFQLAVIAVSLFAGGLIKGAFGVGLPMVAASLMAFFMDVPVAVIIMTMPMLSSNLWQAYRDGKPGTLGRFWPFLIAILPGTWISTKLLFETDPRVLLYVMGGTLAFFSGLQLTPLRMKVSARAERWATPVVGLLAGLVGGLTTFYGAVIALYLVMLDMERDEFIGVIGLLYFFCTAVLLAMLGVRGAVDLPAVLVSAGSCVPMFAGLAIGQKIRSRIRPEVFFRSVSIFLVLVGLSLIVRNLF